MRFRGPDDHGYPNWFENIALLNYYELNNKVIVNEMEARIIELHTLVQKGIMPWMWDYEHYSGENVDMVGIFYPEDFHAMRQIDYLISQNKSNQN